MKTIELVPEHAAIKRAFELDIGIKQEKANIVRSICTAAQYLIEMRDSKLYQQLDYESFNDYLGDPDVIPRSTAYSFIRLYEKYVLQLGWQPEEIERIGHKRLQLIGPVVDRDPEGWKNNAQHLSTSDLINEVREARGLQPMKREEPDKLTSFQNKKELGSSYPEIALSLPCPICGGVPVEKAHYPTTTKAGAKEDEFIPLCHECHDSQHRMGFISWFDMYGRKLFKEFIYPMMRMVRGGQCNSLEALEPNEEMPDLVTASRQGDVLGLKKGDSLASPVTELTKSGVNNGRKKETDCVCCNADSDSDTGYLGVTCNREEEHTAGSTNVVATTVGGESESK